ncbi:phage tail tape measure protein [Staphylococcus casei]|uniref:phage tail tape measure protein n=1 Tax=Staphylococcus casei TaxID=201828 RepID=UPI000CD27144|nr:phage tail tape measure protein [Staphylococcus casei]PNZ60945.1 phage tail tape measure protein [Staphylococcus casei]WJE87433.1 phage tail tape measure protein [Staphylococcus casei]
MSDNIKGVTIRNTMDNSQVEEGFKGLKRQLGLANSELKANLSAFDKSEKSMKQYQTRIDGLNNKMKIQKQMFNQAEQELKDLNANYTKAKQTVSSVEKAYKSLADATKKEKAALDKSNDAVKSSNAELKKSQTQYKRTTEQKDKAYQKLKQLRQAEKELKNSNQATTAQLKKASEATQKQSQKHKELVQRYKEEGSQVKNLKNKNENLATTNKKVKDSYDKTNTELKQTEKEYNKLNSTIKNHDQNLAKAKNAVNNERASMNNLQKTIDKTKNEMKSFNKEQLIANSHFTKTANNLDAMSDKFGKVGLGMSSFGRSMSMYVTTPIVGAMGYASKLGVEFDDGMRKVQATSGATGKDLDALKAKAREMGATTKFSATDSAEAMNYMAMAGWKTQDMISGLPGIMNLAAASGEELGTVSDIVTDGLTAFGLQAKDSGHFADVLASASANANTNVQMMGDGFKYAAPVAGALGYTIEDTSIAIGLMSNAGIKGEKAGTALRTMFTNLAKPTKAMKDKMDELGISITDSNGKMKPMRDVMGDLREKFSGLTKDQQAAAAATIFGKESMSGALAVVNASEKDYNKLSKAIDGSEGSAKKMSNTMEKGLGGSLRELRSAAEELGLSVFETIQPALSGMVGGLKASVDYLNKLPSGAKVAVAGLLGVTAAIGPLALGIGLLLRAIGSAAKGYAVLNRQMAVNSAEAVVNAGANKAAAGTLATTGKATKEQQGLFGKLGNVLTVTTGKYSKLGNAVKIGGKLIGKATIPLTILTTIFGVAYEKMDWFKQGFKDMGKFVNQIGANIDFSWIGKLGKEWDKFKDDMAKGLQDGALFKGIKKGFDGLHSAVSKATDTNNVFGKSVSKGTKKALSSYNDLSEKAKVKLETIQITHEKIGDKQLQQITSLYGNINEEVTKQLNKRHDSEVKGLEKIFKDTSGLSKSEEAKILENTKNSNKKESKEAQKINNQILGIYSVAHKEKRSLTKKENDKIAKLQSSLDNTVVKSLSKGEVEQKAILERMKQNKGKLSMQAAASVIKESAKERDNTVSNAKKKYKATVAEAVKQRDETGTLSKSQADKVIKDAKKQYDESKGKAKKQHKAVVGQAQKQNKGVKKNIDSQTGHVKSKWEVMKDSSIGGAKKISKKVVGYFKDTHQGANKWWSKVGKTVGNKSKEGYNGAQKWFSKTKNKSIAYFKDTKKGADKWWNKLGSKIASESKGAWKDTGKWFSKTKTRSVNYFKDTKQGADKWWSKLGSKIANKSKDSYNSSKKWFGKTKDKSIAYFKDTHGGANKFWNKIGSKIAGKSKDSYNSARKWFGKMKDSTGDRLSKMWGKAKDIFGKIAGEGEDKSKKTHGSWKSWLGKTLDWIKNIKKDFGSAASDLGKSVANKAIDGLNGMIGGINKIAKAITDKTLIKPITPLSTGTYNGASVATDSEGGLRQSTLAVVNDKGAGNAPGGGVQEVIEKADGSLHAPQGRNVVVPLDPGDKVHNATDTKRYKDMGLLPRFASGTKKKKKLQDIIGDKVGSIAGNVKDGASDTAHGIKKKTEQGLEKAADLKDKGVSWLGDTFGDVMDWIDKPGKLVNKVFNSLGLSFGEGKNATVSMAKGAYSKIKTSFIDKVKSMFDEVGGGDGDAAWLFKHDIWQKFGNYTGGLGFNGGKHYGMDFGMLPGTNVYAVAGGKASRVWHDYGGGNSIEVDLGGGLTNWYMHLQKQLVKQGQRIKAGDLIAKSGNTGAFTAGTGHLHFQLNKNGVPKDPEQWLHNLGSKGGGNSGPKAVQAWKPEVMKALGLAGLPQTSAYANAWLRQINTESTGNPKAIGPGSSEGNPKGLVQVKPGTFNAYKLGGHGNIFNGLDNLIAGMRYAKATYGGRMLKQIGVGGPYANGGMVTKHQMAEIGEGNKAEMVIPLTKRNRAVQLIEQAMQYVGMDTGKTNVTVNNDNSTIEKLLKQITILNEYNNKLTSTLINVVQNLPVGIDANKLNNSFNKKNGSKLNHQSYYRGTSLN